MFERTKAIEFVEIKIAVLLKWISA